jgi:hypothetical protein
MGLLVSGSGWIGMANQVEHFLAVVGADRDEEGRFLIGGPSAVVSFMGAGEEVVVPADAVYFVGGKPCPLVAGLRTTSYGMGVVVI